MTRHWTRIWAVIAAIGVVIGIATGGPQLYKMLTRKPDSISVSLVGEDVASLSLSGNNGKPDGRIWKFSRISAKGETVSVPKGAVLITNYLELSDNTKLEGDEFMVLATSISGGEISVSGIDETGAGEHGEPGGTLLVATAGLSGTRLTGNGGKGGDGSAGKDGTDGRDGTNGLPGNCEGFGKYRGAQAGGDGSSGEDGTDGHKGGNGGDAGNITMLTDFSGQLNVSLRGGDPGSGGIPGKGGKGGRGGKGGTGCVGLGGSQENEPDGIAGLDGKDGVRGNPGTPGRDHAPKVIPVHLSEIRSILDREEATPKQIWDAVYALATTNQTKR